MSTVEIYTTPTCGFCYAAKSLLESKQVTFREISVIAPGLRGQMTQRANGRRTVPQIFIGDVHIGGYDDLSALERAGKLDPLLAD